MRKAHDLLSYPKALLSGNMKSHAGSLKKLLIMSFFMMLQNTMFFVLWLILFDSTGDMSGYKLTDVARCFAVVNTAIGLMLFFCQGVRTIPYKVADGSMDFFLTKPAHPLPLLMFSASAPASLGDVFYGPLMLWLFGDLSGVGQWGLMLVLMVLTSIIFFSATLAFYSIPFWLKGSARFPDQLFEMFIIASTSILKNQPLSVKIVIYTIIPAGFMSNFPLDLARHFNIQDFGIMILAAIFYATLAVAIFNAGVRRYRRS
ncbi:MAG: ABC-2 family transporter protein [Alphaproteobacteria bacterium]|nr:ABC-2 family transporter protein [Alphaproteobacteria bacterium]